MIYEKLSPALAALMFEYLRFPEATAASVNGTRPQTLWISADNELQTTILIDCDADAQIKNTDDGEMRTAQIGLDKIADLSERGDIHYLSSLLPTESSNDSRVTEKKVVVAPNRFAPARIAFVVPSNNQPNSPREVVLRGWFEAEGNCEITILSPGGGTTRSIQPEVITGNPTRFGNYHSSQAFLTKPTFAADGRREFFIDLRPIAPIEFVTGGTWKLTVVNVGAAEVNLSVKSWVAGNANEVNFI